MSREKSPAKLRNPLRNRITGSGVVRIDDLLANPQNWRMHPDAQQQALAGVIDDVGFVRSILVNVVTGHVVDGHARIAIAMRSGVEELPVEYVELSEAEEATVLATLDPIGAMAATDRAKLDDLVRQVQSDDERVQALMSEIAEREGLEYGKPAKMDDPGAQVDRAEELRVKWGVEPGQLWKLGEHRMICGDCTDRAVAERAMGGEKAQILFTSPPYWVGFDYEQEDKWSEVLDFISRFCALYVDRVNDDGRIIINTGTVQAGQLTGRRAHMKLLIDTWASALEGNGWLMRYVRFWVKDGGLLHTAPQSDCIDQHTEFIGYFYNPTAKFRGGERTGTPWAGKGYWDDIPGAARQSGHIAAFPVEIPERNIMLYTREGEAVLEPFSGSGTTLIACEQLGRRCRAVEISPAYVAVALERWATATGKTPVRITE